MAKPPAASAASPLALDWDQVRLFLTVVRAGQLSAAAARLGLDVSTVSRRVDRLEADLGLHLFDRGRAGALPTLAAQALLPAAEAMERALADFSRAADAADATVAGVVRLTAPPGLAEAFVAPMLAAFHALHPGVTVELDASIGYADLTRRDADLALRGARPQSGDLVATRVVRAQAVPLAAPAYAKALGAVERWTDARWITWSPSLAHIPTGRWFEAHVGRAAAVLVTDHFPSQLAAAEAGLGVVLAAAPFTAVRRLVPVTAAPVLRPSVEALPVEDLWLVGHEALRTVPRIAALWDFLRDRLTNV